MTCKNTAPSRMTARHPGQHPCRAGELALLAFLPVLLLYTPASHAVDSPAEMLPDPAMEQKAETIGRQLRCLVCQNESIEESSAPLARDLRQIVRQQLRQGRSTAEIENWMTRRYGEFIRLRPVFSTATALLWLVPLLGLMMAALLTRHLWHRTPPPAAPLTPEERQMLDRLPGKD